MSAFFSGRSEAEQQCVQGRKRKRESEAGISMLYQSPGQQHRIPRSPSTIVPFPAGHDCNDLIFDGIVGPKRVLCVPQSDYCPSLGKCAETLSHMVLDQFHRMNHLGCHMVDGLLGPKRFLCGHESNYCSSFGKWAVTLLQLGLDSNFID